MSESRKATRTTRVEEPARRWYPLTPGPRTTAAAAGRRSGGAVAKTTTTPIDPLTGPKLALAGRVVRMDSQYGVLPDAVVYVDKGGIRDVRERTQPPPDGFDGAPPIETGGTIFPGLIELHNHLSYNALPLWSPVPKLFTNRDQWAGIPEYRRLVSGPMNVVGKTPSLLPALVRYVECKCLLAGVTTSQGIRLSSNAGVSRYYRGIVRNVEQTKEAALPEAQTRIGDVEAKDAAEFLQELVQDAGRRCRLLHLSEGVTDPAHPLSSARKHFLALEVAQDEWAITDALAGIHSAGLLPQDFEILATKGGAIVWSPLSNLLLYGDTARVDAARSAGVPIALGSDWSPSGSKNLLGELKVAWLYSQQRLQGRFSARDLVSMATRDAARILKWDAVLGSIEPGKRADLLVVDGTDGDAYDALVRARETSVRLVMINGVARYGIKTLMEQLVPASQKETVKVGGETRWLFLRQATAPTEIASVSLATAKSALAQALHDFQKLAKALETAKVPGPTARRLLVDAPEPVVWSLALDEIRDTGVDLRHRLPYSSPRDRTGAERVPRRATEAARAEPLSQILGPIDLDPLTVVDDDDFLEQIEAQPNVPDSIRTQLRGLY